MKFITVSELRNKATQIVAGIEDTREEGDSHKERQTSCIDVFHYR